MLKILKASAGSGKTYNLAREYIRLLVAQPGADAYRHVLAVTFTNKATEEMKSRILKELYTLAKTPEKSSYTEYLTKECGISLADLQKRSAIQLSGILHDYSSFAVSTIDRFFQQTLRAFSREIGQFSSYQVQLDRKALQQESVDRVLDNLDEEDSALLNWLTEGAREDLLQSGRFSLEDRLEKMAESLKDLPEDLPPFTHESLRTLSAACKNIIESFEKDAEAASQRIHDVITAQGITAEETSHRWLKAIYSPADKPSASFFDNAPDPEKWFAKTKSQLRSKLEGLLEEPLKQFTELFGNRYKEYVTAKAIMGQIYGLGVADALRSAFAEVQKDNNVISIDDSNTILRGIIDGTDAPFIYEKLGVRFEDFLLDEFQDTAEVQWDNFFPLLKNSEATGGSSLVVGDVKQSIYRWRGSDWNLLGSRIGSQFPDAKTEILDGNWRTCREIVEFNNDFFRFAAEKLDAILGLEDSVSAIYKDVEQKVCTKETASGMVEAVFVDDQLSEVTQSVQALAGRGVPWGQIAILVRNNREGASVAEALIQSGIPVVSDDSLYVKSSVTVRRLVSQMSLVETPPDPEKPSAAGYLAGLLEIDVPSGYHSLPDLAEELLRSLKSADPKTFEAEIPYVLAFMDYLRDWVSTGNNNLSSFLKSWEEAEPKISSPESGKSVRVMTVHKSKGLEFPYVIFPFADKVVLYKSARRWCRPRLKGTALEGKADGIYDVSLSSSMADSFFADTLSEEQKLQAVDNVNIFYVALTRAKLGLKIISARPSAKFQTAVKKGQEPEWANLSQILWVYTGGGDLIRGSFPQPLPEDASPEDSVLLGYPSFPADAGGRLRFSPEAADYFGPDGAYGPDASMRIRGNVLHSILSNVLVKADVPGAVAAAVQSGELPSSQKSQTVAFLEQRIDSVDSRGWFSPDVKVLREVPILDTDAHEWRPDRVVIHPDGRVSVIDYKFGEPEEKYRLQVQRYAQLYRRMGYSCVSAYIWYLGTNQVY